MSDRPAERVPSPAARLRLIWRLWRLRRVQAELAAADAIMREIGL